MRVYTTKQHFFFKASSQTVCHNMFMNLIITESSWWFFQSKTGLMLLFRVPVQGQNLYSNTKYLGGWAPPHAEREVVEWEQLLGWRASWDRPHGYPESGWYIHCAGIWPGAVCVCGNCWIHLQAKEDCRTWAGICPDKSLADCYIFIMWSVASFGWRKINLTLI